MKLVPLKQWICDTCGEVIERPNEGYVQFIDSDNDGKYDDFVIVHHAAYSPLKRNNKCYKNGYSDLDLSSFLGTDGLSRLIGLVDPGEFYYPNLLLPKTSNFRKWITLVRRLQTPYYEEARFYFKQAKADGWFDGISEDAPYKEDFLYRIIQKYRLH